MEKRYHFQRALIPGPVTASVSCKKKKKNKRREKRASPSLFFLFFLPDGNPVCVKERGLRPPPFPGFWMGWRTRCSLATDAGYVRDGKLRRKERPSKKGLMMRPRSGGWG